ncbi:hypothetical protein Pan189_11070 [Stratiformator vulcanicus]|uniref:Uncharacterized protein n=1 Tax=Stratiformator vulcanicus TaxID=2527980 RepID=A0A517QYR5_9PLAN|nr:hypothetical protein Pan189_11070 [Stratiformator vulcanicus]
MSACPGCIKTDSRKLGSICRLPDCLYSIAKVNNQLKPVVVCQFRKSIFVLLGWPGTAFSPPPERALAISDCLTKALPNTSSLWAS